MIFSTASLVDAVLDVSTASASAAMKTTVLRFMRIPPEEPTWSSRSVSTGAGLSADALSTWE